MSGDEAVAFTTVPVTQAAPTSPRTVKRQSRGMATGKVTRYGSCRESMQYDRK